MSLAPIIAPRILRSAIFGAIALTLATEPTLAASGREALSSLRMAPSSEAGKLLVRAPEFIAHPDDASTEQELLTPIQAVMPMMPHAMPGMGAAPNGAMGGGGSMPMAMTMTGESVVEMVAGTCAAGVAVGILITLAAPPVTAPMLLTNSGIGCGLGIAATVAGMAGMWGVRAVANGF